MAVSVDLTSGAIAAMVGGKSEGTKPVVQALGIRLIDASLRQQQQSSMRYSLCISDGTHFLQAIAAPKINGLIKDGLLQNRSIVSLKDFIVELIQGRRLIILVDLEILVGKSDLIGEPRVYSSISSSLTNQAPVSRTVEIESKIKDLRKELLKGIDKMDAEYRKHVSQSARDSPAKELELADEWAAKHMKLIKFLEQINQPPPPAVETNRFEEVPSCGS